jgi:TRAP transporter TAXI family solute receptor
MDRLLTFFSSSRGLLTLAGAALLIALVLLYQGIHTGRHPLRISAGDSLGRRAEIAGVLAEEASAHGVDLTLVDSHGSAEALERVQRRELDAALIQGGLDPGEDVREVAALVLEPLHLLVSPDSDVYDIEDLRSQTIQLSPPGSGTRALSLEVLALAGLRPEENFTEVSHTYAELEALDPEELPAAVFTVSALPSPIARHLVEERNYRLVALPLGEAIGVRNVAVEAGVIPAYSYGWDPPMPRADLPTLATRMIVVAHRDASEEAIRGLLEALNSERFLRRANLRPAPGALLERPEMPLHPGTIAYLRRLDPALTSETMQGIESLRSFLVSLALAGILFWRWYRQRNRHGLDSYLVEVSQIDAEALAAERAPTLELSKLLALRVRIGDTKTRALAAFTSGKVESGELLASFLVHVSDVRSHLNAMILHERDRLEKKARSLGERETEALADMWADALADEHEDREPRAPSKVPEVAPHSTSPTPKSSGKKK